MDSAADPIVTPRARVFVVEDEAMISMFLEDRLRELGYDCCGVALRAEDALNRIPAVAPDVVLMDVNLGPGLSGLDVADKLRGLSDAAIIVLTAYADAALVARAASTGSFAFLTKPFDMPVLAANIELVLAKRASEAQLRTINRRLDRTARALEQRTSELQRMYSLLHTAFEATADGLLVIDQQGVQVANPRACQMWGIDTAFQPHEVSGLLDRIAAQLIEPGRFVEAIDDVRQRSAAHDMVLRLTDGRVVEASFRPQTIDQAVVGCVVSFNDVTQRERARQALQESEERYRTLFEDAPVALAITDAAGAPLLSNAAMRRLHEVPPLPSEAGEHGTSGEVACSLFSAETIERLIACVQAPGDVHREESPVHVADGRVLEGVVTVRPVTLQSTPAIMWMIEDITQRKRTQSALETLSTTVVNSARPDDFFPVVAQQLARLLAADVVVISMLMHGEGGARIRTVGFCVDGQPVSPIELDITGTPCETILQQPDAVLFVDDALARYPGVDLFRTITAQGLAGLALRDSKGRKIGSLFVAYRRPIAERGDIDWLLRLFAVRIGGEMERQLEQHRFHDLFEFSPDAILLADATGRIVRVNQKAVEQFGYSRDELLALPIDALLPESARTGHERLRRAFFDSAAPRLMGTQGQPVHVRRKDRSEFPADIGLSPVRSEDGVLVAVDVRDVSERVRAEEQRRSLEAQLRHAQKMEAIGTLAGGIAHDFNNLLAAMVANLELARGDVAPDHPAVESLEAIGVAADRARQLVRQILSFSRRNPPQRVVVTPAALVDEVTRLLRATVPRGINIRTAIEAGVPDVFVDPTQIHQVLMNLATNSWHAIDRGVGEIAFTVDRVTIASEVSLSAGALGPGEYARFMVSDSGKGMTPGTMERMFEPFFTTKPSGRGSGLGLSVVHGIVTDHGGAVSVESAAGAGTRVAIYLPASHLRREQQPAFAETLRAGGGQVAFVDDEIAMAVTAQRLLKRLGYSPTVYERPADLLADVRENPARFDLVITDCNMPEMSGLDVARELAHIRPTLPIVLTSGFTDRTEEELEAAGIRYRLDKPFTMQELSRVIQRAFMGLESSAASSAVR